ncbi:hypothetical protein MRB53_005168 [Persea americana]|uniref:Uncharacterized protein n=1 Tax=Persea americana TaxID=3435 RepID=A0ACC2MCK4_PERAE|nr:hypothetical protein MRB53_005168 [Persea americana]
MGRRFPSEANSSFQPALSLYFLAIWVAMTISMITVLCGARSRKSSAGKSTPPLPSSPSHKTTKVNHMTKPATPLSLAVEKSTHQAQEPELPSTPKSKDTSSSSSSYDQSIVAPLNTSTPTRKLMKSFSLKFHIGLSKIRTGKEEEKQRRNRQQQQQQQQLIPLQQQDKGVEEADECLWKKSIILGERCQVSGDDEDAFFYDEKGNKVMAYTPRTPRTPRTPQSLPVSRTSSYFDLELE